jgi:hypothetical protein
VDAVLDHEPGAGMQRSGTLHQRGTVEAGGAIGRFDLDTSLRDGRSRLVLRSGPMVEANGWDTGPWAARDGAVLSIGLPGAIDDAATERFLRRYGWRDRMARQHMRPLPRRYAAGRSQLGIEVDLPNTSRISLWFDEASGRLAEAVTQADMGPLKTKFADWHRVDGADYAYRREQVDAAGQRSILAVETSRIDRSPLPVRPPTIQRGRVPGRVAVPFTLDHGSRGHIVVAARINGQSAKLVFDTGAANYLTPLEARNYGLKVEGGLDVGGVGETSVSGGYARIAELDIGGARLIDSLAIIAPLPDAAIHPQPGLILQGLTGAELLAAFTTTIDYGASTLSFSPVDDTAPVAGKVLPMVSDGQALFVEATVENWTGWFRLDTGDPGTVTLFPGFARLHGFSNGQVRNGSGGEVGGALRTSTRRFSRVTLAGQTFADVTGEVSAQRAGAFSSRSVAGNLGSGLLSCFVLTLDVRRSRAVLMPLPASELSATCAADLRR